MTQRSRRLNPKDQGAVCIVAQMDKLFEIDKKAREQGLSREDRHVLRLEKAQPLLQSSWDCALIDKQRASFVN